MLSKEEKVKRVNKFLAEYSDYYKPKKTNPLKIVFIPGEPTYEILKESVQKLVSNPELDPYKESIILAEMLRNVTTHYVDGAAFHVRFKAFIRLENLRHT